MRNEEGKSRLDLVKEGLFGSGVEKRGRLVISLDRLIEDPKNERKVFRNMEGLVASIETFGVIEPITVVPEENGFRIVTGHRRYRAAKLAGLEQVEVIIRDPEDERVLRRKSIVSNVQREDIGAVEMAEALQSLLDEDDQISSQRELAKAIGKDETWVSGMLRILTLPPKLQKKLGTSQVSVPYDAVIRIARVKDPEEQEALIKLALKGASAHEIRRAIDAQKQQPERVPSQKRTVSLEGYTATVIGPVDDNGKGKMIAAVEELLLNLKTEIEDEAKEEISV